MSNLSSCSCGGNDSLNTSNSGEMIRKQEVIKELKHTIKQQQELIEDLQIQLRMSEEGNTVLQRECEELRDGTTSMKVVKSQLKAQLRQLKWKVRVQKEKLSHLESQKMDLAIELDVRKAELEGVTRKLLEQKVKLEKLENQYCSQENDKHKMIVNILELEENLIDLTVKFKQLQDKKKVLEAHLSSTIIDQYSVMKSLNYLCKDLESINILNTIQEQVDILQRSTDHVSSATERYGAVQQESHESRAIDEKLLDVENLQCVHEKVHVELQETRYELVENIVLDPASEFPIHPKQWNSLVFPATSINNGCCASNPAFAQPGSIDSTKTPSNSPLTFGEVKGNVSMAPHSRCTSLSPASGIPEGLAPGWDCTDQLDRPEPEHLSNSTVQLGEDGYHERVPSLSESDCADTWHILEDSGSGLIHQTLMAVMDSIPPLNVDYVLCQMCRCVETFLCLVGALFLFFIMFMFVLGNSRITPDEIFELRRYGPPPT